LHRINEFSSIKKAKKANHHHEKAIARLVLLSGSGGVNSNVKRTVQGRWKVLNNGGARFE